MFCHLMHNERSGSCTAGRVSDINNTANIRQLPSGQYMVLCTVQGKPACIYRAVCPAGEAFDKVARLLGLDLRPNGGAALEAFARQGDPYRFKFTVPLQRHVDCNFSYAGLKNSVRLAIEAEAPGAATETNLQVCSHRRPLCVVLKASCALSLAAFITGSLLWCKTEGKRR